MVVEAFGVHSVRGVEGLPPQEVATYMDMDMDALATAASVRWPICRPRGGHGDHEPRVSGEAS